MPTIREIVSNLTNEYSNGTPSQDARMRPRRAWAAFTAAKNDVLAKAMRARKALSSYNKTFIPCIPLIKSSFRDCNCPPVKGCNLKKINCPLVSSLGDELNAYLNITSTDGQVVFSRIQWRDIPYLNHRKFKHTNLFFTKNGYPYIITSDPELSYVSVEMFADDVAKAKECGCKEGQGTECISILDTEVSIDLEFLPDIYRKAKELLYGIPAKEDVTSNARDTPPQESK